MGNKYFINGNLQASYIFSFELGGGSEFYTKRDPWFGP